MTQFVGRTSQDRHHLGGHDEPAFTRRALRGLNGRGLNGRGLSGRGLSGIVTNRPPRQQGPDLVGQPLDDVETHRARAAHVEAIGEIERFRNFRIGRSRRQPRTWRLGQRLRIKPGFGTMLQSPQRQGEVGRGWLEQLRKKDIESTKAHTVFAQRGAGALIEAFDVVGDAVAFESAQVFTELKRDTPCKSCHIFGLCQIGQGLQLVGHQLAYPRIEARLYFLPVLGRHVFVDQQFDGRLQRICATGKPRNLVVAPEYFAGAREAESIGLGRRHTPGPHSEFPGQHLRSGVTRGLAVDAFGFGVRPEPEPFEAANSVIFDLDGPVAGNFGGQFFVVAQPLHERTRARIDETLREAFM